MQDGYQVYIFKEGTTLQEKTVFNSLIDTFNFKLEDYSDSFCKVNFIQTSNSTLEDKSTLQCFP